MPAIFNREDTQVNGVFSSDTAKLQMGAGLGVLVQGMNFNYSQQVTRLYEIGTTGQDKTNIYYVGGRTAGQMGLSRVIGPKTTIKELYKEYGDVCKSCNNTIELQLKETDCCQADTTTANGSEITYTLKHVVLIQVGIQIGAQDMMINEQSSLMFSGLDYT
jgi:hypothetical protein